MKNNWKKYIVRYWNHDNRIYQVAQGTSTVNDCYGNSVSWTGKARTDEEAIRKARQTNACGMSASSIQMNFFRLHSIKLDNH